MAFFFNSSAGTNDIDYMIGADILADHIFVGSGERDLIIGDYGDVLLPTIGNDSVANAQNLDNSAIWTTDTNPIFSAGTDPYTSVYKQGEGARAYYAFTVAAGETFTLDVDFATFDTSIEILFSNGDKTGVANNDGGVLDPGSFATRDSFVSTANSTGVTQTFVVEISDATTGTIAATDQFFLHIGVGGHAATGGMLEGDDMLFGGIGDDQIYGVGGNDTINGGFGADILDGGANTAVGDTISYVGSVAGVTVNLGTSTASGGDAQGDTISGFENISGSGQADMLFGDGGNNTIKGGGGADTVNGGGGDDRLDGGTAADTLQGGTGNDTYIVDNVGDVVTEAAGDASDQVFTTVSYNVPENVEVLIMGGTADLQSFGTAARDIIIGNSGNNSLIGLGSNDVLQGGDGNDTYGVDNSSDAVVETATGGNDAVNTSVDFNLANSPNVETLILRAGEATAVQAFGDDNANQLFGNEFTNNLFGAGGTDFMLGGGGADNFIITPEAGAVDVIGDWKAGGADRIGIAGFGAGAQVVQVSTASFEIRSADMSITQQFILQGYPGGTLVEGADFFFG